MRNERGITLVELLATLVLVGIITALAISVLVNGSNASKRTAANQKIQQEANYIVEVIRNKYLENSDGIIKLEIKSGGNPEVLLMNGMKISEGYKYSSSTLSIDRRQNVKFIMILENEQKNTHKIETTFSKLR